MLQVEHIYKSYGDLPVLRDVNLYVNTGELVGIVGKSGAGKSTLLHIAGTLDSADKGQVVLKDKDITRLKGNALSDFRNKYIGFIFQFHHLLPEFTALENIMIPALIANTGKKAASQKAEALLEAIGLSDRSHHKPDAMSGGEQQRVAIARALVNDPAIVFADEPTGNLDDRTADAVHDLMLELNEELGTALVIVTHDMALAARMNTQLRLHEGRLQPL